MCSGSGGRSFQLNRVKQLPPTAVEGPCAAKFMLKALVGSGDTAGAAAQSMMDFNTGQHSLRMEPGRAVPVQLAGPWEWSEVGLPVSGWGAFLSEWSGLLPPQLPSREGQVVVVILQLAPATERFANNSGVQIPATPSLSSSESAA